MKLLAWLRRDRVAPLMTDDGLEARLRYALHADAERLFPGTDADMLNAKRIVSDYCQPIPCDLEDNYVCAAHRNG